MYDIFLLKDNPFKSTPPRMDEPITWAGNKDLLEGLQNKIKISMRATPTRAIVCYGEWGTGKTHAMRYFLNERHLKPLYKEFKISKPLVVPVTISRAEVFPSLYTSIIEGIGLKTLEFWLDEVIKKIGTKALEKEGKLEEEIRQLVVNEPRLEKILTILATAPKTDRDYYSLIIERYLFGTANRADLNELGFPRGIETQSDEQKMIFGIFNTLTNSSESIPEPFFSKIILWIDEAENAVFFSGRDINAIQGFSRDLIDFVSSNLIIFLNCTLMEGYDLRLVMGYWGDALTERVYKYQILKPLTVSLAVQYVEEMLNMDENRSKEQSEKTKGNSYFPFTEDSIKYLISIVETNTAKALTPRKINDAVSSLLDVITIDTKSLEKIKKGSTIDKKLIDDNIEEIISSLEIPSPESNL